VIYLGRRSAAKKSRALIFSLIGIVLVAALSATLIAVNIDFIRDKYREYTIVDFEGPGFGEIIVRIDEGDDGLVIAQKLFDAGVVKQVEGFYRLMLQTNPTFYPGSFILKSQMSFASALEVIQDPTNVKNYKITIPEGFRAIQIFNSIAEVTGYSIDEIKKEAANLAGLGIPAEAPTIEGYLFPATYTFYLEDTPADILRTMVERMKEELAKYNVAESDWHTVLTLASITQREAKLPDDFYKVTRVFSNRINRGMLLQTDPTISYNYEGIELSKPQKDANPFNTYVINGLPPGPISSPGSLAIDATVNPAPGDWLYFVTIDLRSGETIFTSTYAQHEKYVKVLRQWEKDNPGWYDN
jgi:UPF0755 protein